MTEVKVGRVEDIPDGGMVQYDHDGECVLLCRKGAEVYAVEGICPHRGAQLAMGRLEDSTVVCPWHDWGFDVTSGCGVTNPVSQLRTYKVRIADGEVLLNLKSDDR